MNERIISDVYEKKDKRMYGDDPTTPFNQRVLAVNAMYGWLYAKGILKAEAFAFVDYDDAVFFAMDVNDLLKYRAEMEASGCNNAALAVRYIFDEEYTPCIYSGAFQPGWLMHTYRDCGGCVGRSWECDMVKHLRGGPANEVAEERRTNGVKAAVKKLYSMGILKSSSGGAYE